MMSLDNGLAHMQPDSHSLSLSCIESLKEFVRSFRCEAVSDIFDAEAHPARPVPFGPDEQFPRTILYQSHRIRGIAHQIKNHLLQLDTIPINQRKTVGKLRFQDHAIPLKIAQRQCDLLPAVGSCSSYEKP